MRVQAVMNIHDRNFCEGSDPGPLIVFCDAVYIRPLNVVCHSGQSYQGLRWVSLIGRGSSVAEITSTIQT